jgi:hypothetical protein
MEERALVSPDVPARYAADAAGDVRIGVGSRPATK